MNQIAGRKATGGHFMALILEPGNIQRLQEGKPIQVHIEDMFPDGIPKKLDLDIFYSETPVHDARELTKLSEVAFDERTPVSKTKRPHCPECRSTIEQLGAMRNDSPLALVFCPACGCVLGVAPSGDLSGLQPSKALDARDA